MWVFSVDYNLTGNKSYYHLVTVDYSISLYFVLGEGSYGSGYSNDDK